MHVLEQKPSIFHTPVKGMSICNVQEVLREMSSKVCSYILYYTYTFEYYYVYFLLDNNSWISKNRINIIRI